MDELTLATPSILFSAISLIMLAYTNRFLGYAQLVRTISEEYKKEPCVQLLRQLRNLQRRLYLTRTMQITGVASLLVCVICTLFLYFDWRLTAVWLFGAALVLLIISLSVSIAEILISVRALEIHLEECKKTGDM